MKFLIKRMLQKPGKSMEFLEQPRQNYFQKIKKMLQRKLSKPHNISERFKIGSKQSEKINQSLNQSARERIHEVPGKKSYIQMLKKS